MAKTTGRRSNGAGTLIKTSTGLFIAKWCFKGKTYTRSTKCYERDKALIKLEEYVRPYLEQTEIAVLENLEAKIRTIKILKSEEVKKESLIELSTIFEKFISHPNTSGYSESTEYNYKCIVSVFLKWMGQHYKSIQFANHVSKEIVQEFLADISKRLCPNRYNCILDILRKIYKCLELPNVWEGFNEKKIVNIHERRALTKDELNRLLNYLPSLKKDLRLVFTLAIYCGLRASDCCLIKWNNIDFENNIIKLIPQKTRKNGRMVIIPIHENVLKCLSEFKRGEPDDYVSNLNAHYIQTQSICAMVKKILIKCGITELGSYVGLHVLRHTFCTIMANSGVPMPVLQNLLGHSKPDMTMKYYHPTLDSAISAIKKIAI